MPVAAKAPLSSKNPATVAKKIAGGTGSGAIVGGAQQTGGEVVCPLLNDDGSICRKKCVGNFAYRSICEHIRRAHPDNWIPKLPASPETFAKMVSMTPKVNVTTGFNHVRRPVPAPMPKKVKREFFFASYPIAKQEDGHYMDNISPPSSANEDAIPALSLSVGPTAFQSKFPPAFINARDYDNDHGDDDDDLDAEHELDDEMDGIHEVHSETETEDDDRLPFPYSHQFAHHHHHHIHPSHPQGSKEIAIWSSVKSRSTHSQTRRKRDGHISANTRWDELIEAATTRAFVEESEMSGSSGNCSPVRVGGYRNSAGPLSPPPTAISFQQPTAPNSSATTSPQLSAVNSQLYGCRSSASSISSISSTPRLQCAECHDLVPLKESFACTECIAGFCPSCALAAGRKGVCSECRALGGKFKPVRMRVL
ncbi:hypothetical protein RUND412_000313 [Rhizina undulata]